MTSAIGWRHRTTWCSEETDGDSLEPLQAHPLLSFRVKSMFAERIYKRIAFNLLPNTKHTTSSIENVQYTMKETTVENEIWTYIKTTTPTTASLVQCGAQICKRLWSQGIDSSSLWGLVGRYNYPICRTGPPGSLKVYKFVQSMGARNRVGIGLSYRPARLHRLVESIPGPLKSLKIPSQ
jgi:hypothetical protein